MLTIVQSGSRIVVGGTFTTVQSAGSSTTLPRNFLLAFDATTGVVDPGFAPALNGEVDALAPSAGGTSVYVGGQFTAVNGQPSRSLAMLRFDTGATVSTFHGPVSADGSVNDLQLAGGRLFVGGSFTKLNGINHAGLASLDPSSGAVDPAMNVKWSLRWRTRRRTGRGADGRFRAVPSHPRPGVPPCARSTGTAPTSSSSTRPSCPTAR